MNLINFSEVKITIEQKLLSLRLLTAADLFAIMAFLDM